MFFYQLVGNYGWAVILFAIVVKVILLPFQMKSKRGTMRTARIQPKLTELQKKHAANKTKLNEEMTKLYKQEGVSPMSGCIWGLLPFPILLALYTVIRQPLTIMMGVASGLLEEGGAILAKLQEMNFTSTIGPNYLQIEQAQFISSNFAQFSGMDPNLRVLHFNFLGMNLGLQPQWDFLWNSNLEVFGTWMAGFALFLIPIISGGFQFISARINQKMNPVVSPTGQGGSMKTMMMLMPLFSIYIAFVTPAALGLYWAIGAVLQIAQDIWLTKRYTRIMNAEDALKNEERNIKEAELEAKRLETERKKAEGIVERNPNTSKRKKQMNDKQEQIEKAAEWQKKDMPPAEEPASKVGERRFARGRAYEPERFSGTDDDNADLDEPEETPDDEPEETPDVEPEEAPDDKPETRLEDEVQEALEAIETIEALKDTASEDKR